MFSKIVSVLISPLGTALFMGCVGLVWLLWPHKPQWRKAGTRLCLAGLVWLWVWSTPLASGVLRGAIEARAGQQGLGALAPAPVIVVLGGGIAGARLPLRTWPDLNSAADRMWHGARLYHAGKAAHVLLSGGTVRTGDGSEAQAMKTFMLDLGVPESALWLEDGSSNTAANAKLTAQRLADKNINTVILVTSALHMPRARQAFERAGLKVHAAPTDFEVITMPFDVLQCLPDAAALNGSARAFKELLGQLVG